MIATELVQVREEGRDLGVVGGETAVRTRLEAATGETELLDLWRELHHLPQRADFGFDEPSDLEAIRALRSGSASDSVRAWGEAELFDRLHGAWLGRCVGCALGKPVELFMNERDGLSSRERIKAYLTAISPDQWPLRDYFPGHSPAQARTGSVICPLSTREQIAFMETDDDIRYTVLGQIVLQQHGRDFTTWDVADVWMHHLPYKSVCTAETQAYRNLVRRYDFHLASGWGAREPEVDWHWVATEFNPYREWIGAQIRADPYGYAAPSDPELAAEFAWRDARLSHVKNGIYGAMLCAAMLAAAFGCDEPLSIVEAGLAQIPTTSRLHWDLRAVVEICRRHAFEFEQFEAVLGEIYALLGHYHVVHTNPNAALVVAALLLGGRDFGKVVTLAVMGGWDSDCNGATAGSICGAMLGAAQLPAFWTERLHDTLNSQIAGYHPISIAECARRSIAVARA